MQQNTSDLKEQRFSPIFTGREFFFASTGAADHAVKGQRVFPGSAGLEMARAAIIQSTGAWNEGQTGIQLQNVWTQPVVVGDQPIRLHIGVFPEENGRIAFEIYSRAADDTSKTVNDEPVVYSQGLAVLTPDIQAPYLNLQELREQCTQGSLNSKTGITVDPDHPGVAQIYNGLNLLLAKLILPSSEIDTSEQFIIYPWIVDSVLQLSAISMIGARAINHKVPCGPSLSFAFQELTLFDKCATKMWAAIEVSEFASDGYAASESFSKAEAKGDPDQWMGRVNIELCDEQGKVCIRIKGLQIREEAATMISIPALTNAQSLIEVSPEPNELMTFEEIWQEEGLPDTGLMANNAANPPTLVCFLSDPETQQTLLEELGTQDQPVKAVFITQSNHYQKLSEQLYGINRADAQAYREAFRSIREDVCQWLGGGPVDAVLYLWPLEDSSCIQDYSCLVYILQAISAAGLKTKRVLFAGQFANGLDRCYLESWIGFERSLGLILPDTGVAVICQEIKRNRTSLRDWMRKLKAGLQTPQAQSVLYQQGKRYVSRIRPTTIPARHKCFTARGDLLDNRRLRRAGILVCRTYCQALRRNRGCKTGPYRQNAFGCPKIS